MFTWLLVAHEEEASDDGIDPGLGLSLAIGWGIAYVVHRMSMVSIHGPT